MCVMADGKKYYKSMENIKSFIELASNAKQVILFDAVDKSICDYEMHLDIQCVKYNVDLLHGNWEKTDEIILNQKRELSETDQNLIANFFDNECVVVANNDWTLKEILYRFGIFCNIFSIYDLASDVTVTYDLTVDVFEKIRGYMSFDKNVAHNVALVKDTIPYLISLYYSYDSKQNEQNRNSASCFILDVKKGSTTVVRIKTDKGVCIYNTWHKHWIALSKANINMEILREATLKYCGVNTEHELCLKLNQQSGE